MSEIAVSGRDSSPVSIASPAAAPPNTRSMTARTARCSIPDRHKRLRPLPVPRARGWPDLCRPWAPTTSSAIEVPRLGNFGLVGTSLDRESQPIREGAGNDRWEDWTFSADTEKYTDHRTWNGRFLAVDIHCRGGTRRFRGGSTIHFSVRNRNDGGVGPAWFRNLLRYPGGTDERVKRRGCSYPEFVIRHRWGVAFTRFGGPEHQNQPAFS
jgi:hypothetical protein